MSDLIMQTDVKVVGAHETDTAELPVGRPLRVRCFGLTDAGQVRKSNEDQFLIADLVKALRVRQTSVPQPQVQKSSERSYLFAVADGIGGNAGGERASALAIDCVERFLLESCQWFARLHGEQVDPVFADFRRALGQANARLLEEESAHPELSGLGTTLTLAFCLDAELFVAHAGDCRCYLFRTHQLYRLTEDHTLAEEMVRAGALTPQDAAQSRWSHIVTNAVGGSTVEVKIELHKVGMLPGDVLLLCSDGLTGMVTEAEIARVLRQEIDSETACRQLIARANEEGGRDNVTVVVACFEED
jgi:PPM family protein phosphatase